MSDSVIHMYVAIVYLIVYDEILTTDQLKPEKNVLTFHRKEKKNKIFAKKRK